MEVGGGEQVQGSEKAPFGKWKGRYLHHVNGSFDQVFTISDFINKGTI